MEEKTCSHCKLIKPVTEFSARPERKSGYRSKCKACERETRNSYNYNNREHVRALQRKWCQEHVQACRDKVKKYQTTEKGKLVSKKSDKKRSKAHNEYARKRYFSDPQWNLNMKLRRRIQRLLTNRKITKSEKTMVLLGCTYTEYQKHIESLFTEGMTWENVLNGKIHIDHIKPCASFDLTDPEQQKQCFHYTNLQPLWAKDNLKKGKKLL